MGGWWKADNGDWVQVGPAIKRFVANNVEILENVGLSSNTPDVPGMSHLFPYPGSNRSYTHIPPGTVRLAAYENKRGQRRKRNQVSWEATKASRATNTTPFLHMQNELLFPVRYLVARSSDRCEVGSWVVAHSPQHVRIWYLQRVSHALRSRTTNRTQGERCMAESSRLLPHRPRGKGRLLCSIYLVLRHPATLSSACRSFHTPRTAIPIS